eukprot:TRINITY_DN76905_c0_g1_i1.p1 TRINITY_DN76905_c0_g1~~TRINITY_DN76905_c0_g1_i1.p1  ORF type:complete len:500 (-),score=110.51 TRINITY_DN76905_c0_g1_i1:155-1654(-)
MVCTPEPSGQPRSARARGTLEGLLRPTSREEVLARRRQRRYRSDHSAFSVLNLDVRPDMKRLSVARHFCGPTACEECPLPVLRRTSSSAASAPLPAVPEATLQEQEEAEDSPTGLRRLPEPEADFCTVRASLLAFRGMASCEDDASMRCEAPEACMCVVLPSPIALLADDLWADKASAKQSKALPPPPLASPVSSASCSLSPSANGYRIRQPQSPEKSLQRCIQSLLNKICPENVAAVLEKIAAVEVKELTELEVIIELIFKKAVSEPHYCESYADLVFGLKSVYPEFPSPDGGRNVTFRALLLNICQSEFEELPKQQAAEQAECVEEDATPQQRRNWRERMRANMKFVGHLFLRELLSAKVIGSVMCELVLTDSEEHLPEEHALECVCELILAIGYTLENVPAGKLALNLACQRLKDLLQWRHEQTGKPAYCKRILFMIQDLLDVRVAGWTKKVFKTTAKTKEEIRMAQEKEMREREGGCRVSPAECIVTGQKPGYLS